MVSPGLCFAFLTARTFDGTSARTHVEHAVAAGKMPLDVLPDAAVPAVASAARSPQTECRTSYDQGDVETRGAGAGPIHFCFIVHGHQGRPGDLSYLHRAVKARAGEAGSFADAKSSDQCVVGKAIDAEAHGDHVRGRRRASRRKKRDRVLPSGTQQRDTFVVHNASCNEGRTGDGIVKGGERLAEEMLGVIRAEVQRKMERNDVADRGAVVDVSISLVGNSLGGLYGRYAIAHLADVLDNPDRTNESLGSTRAGCYLLDGNIRVHFNVFCSTASPHLGCASHTFVPIPRTAEIGVAKVLGETGSDLFRLNDLVETMATSPRFLQPLASFRRRIAYANAYSTDFPVPGSTAAFLSSGSDYPHYFDEHVASREHEPMSVESSDASSSAPNYERTMGTSRKEGVCPATERGLIVATLHTPQRTLGESEKMEEHVDGLTAMSTSLDSLGWKKVFVDIRGEIPRLPVPLLSEPDCPIGKLRSSNNPSVSSRDLEKAVSTASVRHLPLGHNAICAFSRSSVSTALNSGGRPVMESLAIELVSEISSWAGPN